MSFKSFKIESTFSFVKAPKSLEELDKIHSQLLSIVPKIKCPEELKTARFIDALCINNHKIKKDIALEELQRKIDSANNSADRLKDAAEHGESQRLVEELN